MRLVLWLPNQALYTVSPDVQHASDVHHIGPAAEYLCDSSLSSQSVSAAHRNPVSGHGRGVRTRSDTRPAPSCFDLRYRYFAVSAVGQTSPAASRDVVAGAPLVEIIIGAGSRGWKYVSSCHGSGAEAHATRRRPHGTRVRAARRVLHRLARHRPARHAARGGSRSLRRAARPGDRWQIRIGHRSLNITARRVRRT